MYIKFLIGSILFAGICFGIGYRVCHLRMDKKLKDAEDLKTAMEQRYLSLRKAYLRLSMAMEEGRIATPVCAPARNDGEGAAGSEGSSGGSGAFAEHIERRFKGEV